MLTQFIGRLQYMYGDKVTVDQVKCQVDMLKRHFMSLQEFLALPGVRLIQHKKRVNISAEYWANFGPNGRASVIFKLIWFLIKFS